MLGFFFVYILFPSGYGALGKSVSISDLMSIMLEKAELTVNFAGT